MFRMLVHSSSGACDCVWVYSSGSMCVGVTVWFGCCGVVSLCRLRQLKYNSGAKRLIYIERLLDKSNTLLQAVF